MEDKYVWLLAFLVKLGRGDRVKDAAEVADKSLDEFTDRWDT